MENQAKTETQNLFTTAEFAAALKQSPGTIRKNHCLQGHHLGARPIRLVNGRLRWRATDAQKILKGEVLK